MCPLRKRGAMSSQASANRPAQQAAAGTKTPAASTPRCSTPSTKTPEPCTAFERLCRAYGPGESRDPANESRSQQQHCGAGAPAGDPPPAESDRAEVGARRASAASGDLARPPEVRIQTARIPGPTTPPLGKNTGNVSLQQKRAKNRPGFGVRSVWQGYELLDRYRRFAGRRCAKCRRVRIAPHVEISKLDGRTHYHGLMRCGLAWECPVCQLVLRTARAAEVVRVVECHTSKHGVESAALLTLTIRHGLGDDVRALRSGVAGAWRRFQSGKVWREWKATVQFVGSIRALELTYGDENGWHPHLHIVLLTQRPLTSADRAWLSGRWQRAVLRALGPDHVPDDYHGCDLRPCHAADYLQKLGLEVSPPAKAGRGEHRTPLQLLSAFACDGDLGALALYQAYAIGMKGAKMLTWTAGLKRAAGVDDRTDAEVIEGEEGSEELVLAIKGEAWDALRDIPGIKVAILALAESETPEVVREWLGQLTLWPPGYEPCEPPIGAPGLAQAVGGAS